MKFCQPHWDAMRAAVKARGLFKFVAASGEEAAENMRLAVEGHGEPFDPLMGGMWKIATQVGKNIERSQGPLSALQCMGDPTWCPLCFVQESYDNLMTGGPEIRRHFMRTVPSGSRPLDAQGWIDATMDSALEYARAEKMPIRGAGIMPDEPKAGQMAISNDRLFELAKPIGEAIAPAVEPILTRYAADDTISPEEFAMSLIYSHCQGIAAVIASAVKAGGKEAQLRDFINKLLDAGLEEPEAAE